jgi:signal transduction histidine kinase/ActR/RegA family two-component response regulator
VYVNADQGQTTFLRPKRLRSLASKFSVFTAALVFWVVATFMGYDLRQDTFDVSKGILLCVIVLLVAAAIGRFTIRLLARPLVLLQAGITSARNGHLIPVRVSHTGDEIEYLAESFNRMIEALAASQKELLDHQELLEERIRQRTEELQATTLRAEAASKAKSEFLANMSHELRTPMNGVIGMVDLAMEGKLTTEQRERLQTAQQCAYSLLSLLNDILDLSKIEAGKMSLESIPFDLWAMVEDCVRSHMPSAARNHVDLNCNIANSVPRQVIGDPLRLRQILANLLSNAVKFTENGSIDARMRATTFSATELLLQIVVQDTGPGIDPAKLPFIFDKFTQADGSVSRKYGGTGLGLAITRKLAELYGGEINVESEPGRGTIFSVNLKLGVAAQTGAPAAIGASGSGLNGPGAVEIPVPPPEPEPAPANAGRILVVEDNHVNQKVVTAVLRKRGFSIDLAKDGREALARLESDVFDLVLMDVQMPVLDGLEATRLIREDPRWKTLPIIAMTAHAMNGDRERCLDAGMSGYISKPVHPSHLLQIIDEHLLASTRVQ